MIEKDQSPYLRFINRTGLTEHPRGFKATKVTLARTRLGPKARVLDLGSGAGHSSAFVAKNSEAQIYGIDISQHALDNAHKIYQKEPFYDRMTFEIGDASCLPFSENYFDLILCESVLLFIADKKKVLSELVRVCRPKGKILLNELCLKEKDLEVIKFLSDPAIDAQVVESNYYREFFSSKLFKIMIDDEKELSIKDQIFAEARLFFSISRITNFLAGVGQAFSDPDFMNDLKRLLALYKKCPSDLSTKMVSQLFLVEVDKKSSNQK